MKNLILILPFLFTFFSYAQEINTTETNSKTVTEISPNKTIKKGSLDTICYGETSKVAFFEMLIEQNGFDIKLKNSKKVAIKDVKDFIIANKNQILYSKEDSLQGKQYIFANF